mmetsp:Transcript_39800/g.64767  ORF Transcript_39800/g.64767 Transcript_39800/m.64767 type:complete len:227 (+) Transcript_39800:24-704(+)
MLPPLLLLIIALNSSVSQSTRVVRTNQLSSCSRDLSHLNTRTTGAKRVGYHTASLPFRQRRRNKLILYKGRSRRVRVGSIDEEEDLMMDLDLGSTTASTTDGDEQTSGRSKFSLQAIHGECKQIGFDDGIRAEIVSKEGGEGNIVGFFTLREAEGDMFKLYVDRFQMAPLEAYKRSLICGFLLDELASKRTVSELTVDTHDWAEKEGDYALSKIKPFAGFAEKKNM